MTEQSKDPAGFWAVVEIMGHVTLAGLVSEWTFAGAAFVKIDVPGDATNPPVSIMHGPQAIYAIKPCDEATARYVAARSNPHVISHYDARRALEMADRENERRQLAGPSPLKFDVDGFVGHVSDEWDGDEDPDEHPIVAARDVREVIATRDLSAGDLVDLENAEPPAEAAAHDHEVDGELPGSLDRPCR